MVYVWTNWYMDWSQFTKNNMEQTGIPVEDLFCFIIILVSA